MLRFAVVFGVYKTLGTTAGLVNVDEATGRLELLSVRFGRLVLDRGEYESVQYAVNGEYVSEVERLLEPSDGVFENFHAAELQVAAFRRAHQR